MNIRQKTLLLIFLFNSLFFVNHLMSSDISGYPSNPLKAVEYSASNLNLPSPDNNVVTIEPVSNVKIEPVLEVLSEDIGKKAKVVMYLSVMGSGIMLPFYYEESLSDYLSFRNITKKLDFSDQSDLTIYIYFGYLIESENKLCYNAYTLKTSSNNDNLDNTTVSPDLEFTPDSGIRMDNASNPGAIVDNETGIVYLYYEKHTGTPPGTQKIAKAEDGLNFSDVTTDLHASLNPRAVKLPDGTWRKYIYLNTENALKSESSKDGYTFTEDEGARYQPEENIGVYDVYVDKSGGVVLLYVGDMGGDDNVRRAYSTDGGDSFTLETDDLLGDKDLDATMKYVDPKTLLLPDGRRRLITMKRGENGAAPIVGKVAIGELHTFISSDDKNYTHEPGIRLKPEDFTEFTVWSLNDPSLVRLKDGRYRIYVAAIVTDDKCPEGRWAIISATSKGSEN